MVENKKAQKRRGIQSVEIGLRVLAAVAKSGRPSSLSMIAESSNLSASQAHRYLTSLIVSGMVKQESKSGQYDLAFGAVQIGLAALSRIDAFRLADKKFNSLSDETRYTFQVAIWGEEGPVIVRWFPGDPPVVTSLAIGSTLPLLQSATGRVFFAFADESVVMERAKKEARKLGRPIAEFLAIRAQVRANQMARVEGDLIPGLRALAAPVFDLQGRLAFVASMVENVSIAPEFDQTAMQTLIDACKDLTESLGGRWPSG